MTAPCFDETRNAYRCPSLKEAPNYQEGGCKKAFDGAAFFVPAKENAGIYLVVFARSLNAGDLVKSAFTINVGGIMRQCSNFIFLGKNEPLGSYVGPVPYLASLIDDPYYYAIAKFFITKDQLARHAGQQFIVLLNGKTTRNYVEKYK